LTSAASGYEGRVAKLDREQRRIARGRRDDVPVRALTAVWVIVAAAVAVLLAVALAIWLLLR
jgi:hypothetical protein